MSSKVTIAALALVLCAPALRAQQPPTLDAYRAELQHWSDQVGALHAQAEAAQKLRAGLPKVLVVVVPDGRRFEASTEWLNAALGEFVVKADKRAALAGQIQARLKAMREQAEEFRQPVISADARARLGGILARREFRRIQGPTAWDLWRERIVRWLWRALDRIFGKIPTSKWTGQIFVWLAIAAGTCALAVWLKRKAAHARVEQVREPIPFSPSAWSWRRWLAEARTAAQEGRWRDAVHLAYWAGISHLEESGAWVPDRARTPREYLRLLPATSERRPTLTALTRKFEVIWYGGRVAGAGDFNEAVSQLEALGCR